MNVKIYLWKWYLDMQVMKFKKVKNENITFL